jgi:hypothetical protein
MQSGSSFLFRLGESAPSSTRGVPQSARATEPNTQQVRAEIAAADAAVPVNGLDVAMIAVTPGAGVPIVFCREVDGLGGCWISPPCVQYGFIVDASNNVEINYTIVIGQGEYPAIPDADVYYGSVLFNTLPSYSLVQEYQALPYNVTVNTSFHPSATLDDIPSQNGGGGSFQDLTVLGCYAALTAPANWDRQVHVYLRDGLQVTRYVDGIVGPSNNFADLAKYLLVASGELNSALIDDDSLELTAQFLDAEGIRFSGVLTGTASLEEYLSRTAPLLLCIYTVNQGKRGLIPALPVADDYTISTAFVTPAYSYTAADLVTGSLEVQYVPTADRKPFQAVMTWRDPATVGAIKQTAVGYTGRATAGPFEQYDLSGFCVSESQAIRIGRYIVAQRLYVGHSVQFQLLPSVTAPAVGDLFLLQRDVMPNGMTARRESYVYRATAVGIAPDGNVSVTATHFPRDTTGASQVAQEITAVAFLDAQTPEDWSDLPAYDSIPSAAVVGGSNYISATGGTVFYQGDYKYHVFGLATIQSSVFPEFSAEPSEAHLWYELNGRRIYKKLINSGVFAFTGQTNQASLIGSTSSTYIQSLISTIFAAQAPPLTDAPANTRFRIFSTPIGGTMDVLAVGGGGMAFSPGFGCFQPGGGGEVIEQTIAATPGFYSVHYGRNGLIYGSRVGAGFSYIQEYLGQFGESGDFINTADFSDSVISYNAGYYDGPNARPVSGATNLIIRARGGRNAFSGVDPTFVQNGASGNGNARGTASGSTYGGAGGAGGAGSNAVSSSVGGAGGAGVTSSIFGTAIEFGRGGGGGVGDTSVPSPTAGATLITPGSGGGGLNGVEASPGTLTSAGYAGRDGIVVIRYRYRG